MGASGFTCIADLSISGFDGIVAPVRIPSWRHRRNIFHRDTSTNLLHRDINRDDCRIPLLRDASIDGCRNSRGRDVCRDNSRTIIVEMM